MTHPPYLVDAANKLGVAIDTVQGTGPDGRVTITDIRNAANPPTQRTGPSAGRSARNATVARRPSAVMRPMTDPWGNGTGPATPIDVYDANPYVTYVLQTSGAPKLPAEARPGYRWVGAGTPPTFFVSGTLPPLTASGADPAILAQVPWQFRHTAALAADYAHVLRLVELGAEFDGDEPGLNTDAGTQALHDYRNRVWAWAVPTEVPAEVTEAEYREMFPDEGDAS